MIQYEISCVLTAAERCLEEAARWSSGGDVSPQGLPPKAKMPAKRLTQTDVGAACGYFWG